MSDSIQNQANRRAFVDLLQRQVGGESSADRLLRAFNPDPKADFWLHFLWTEWSDAFSYAPGRLEALSPLLGLARKLADVPKDADFDPYKQPEWIAIVDLRGPAECMLFRACDRCGQTYVRAGMSGFLDEIDWVCLSCGDVCFKSIYVDVAPPPCKCGTAFTAPSVGCPHCGSDRSSHVASMSPFEYFASHQYSLPDRE
jgi:hypothetical protein